MASAESVRIAAYVSGHGFGHATRTAEVLARMQEIAPGAEITVNASAPEAIFRTSMQAGFAHRPLATDVGLAQKSALEIDEEGTLALWRAFEDGQEARVAGEAEWLRASGIDVVLGDVPPLAFLAAASAGIPSVALANFSWDWIYRHLARRRPAFAEAADAAAAAYAHATLLLEVPFAGDLSVFPRRERIPFVARSPRVPRPDARVRLGLRGGDRAVLLSFGGVGLPGFDPRVLAVLPEYRFLTDSPDAAHPGNAEPVTLQTLTERGLGYPDLVAAVDVVVTKPGYGIVAEAIAGRTRIVYTERGDFPEYPIMVAEMPRYLPCAHVSNADLAAGRIGPALREVLAQPMPAPVDVGGAAMAARRLLEVASARTS